jgi:signal transduction histidine kinase
MNDLEGNSSVAVMTLNDLINYDKIETKTFAIEEKDVDIWSVIEKTVGPLTLQAKEKNIDLSLVTRVSDHGVPFNLDHLRVVGDSIKLGQVVRNLVSNALKFTPPHGEVKITGTESFFSASSDLLLSYLPSNRNSCDMSSPENSFL